MENKQAFKNGIIVSIDIFFILTFIVLISFMFIKNIDFVYIICTGLIVLLPLSDLYKYFRKKKS
ncbi:hypothetical protein BU068_13105 [Staphylococcus succinus]|nr:hypothetical protein BU062_13795 [Staphylococcus succinus]RIN28473.1 hypothetical protein BU068_13105 [Staphylococcus succinus]